MRLATLALVDIAITFEANPLWASKERDENLSAKTNVQSKKPDLKKPVPDGYYIQVSVNANKDHVINLKEKLISSGICIEDILHQDINSGLIRTFVGPYQYGKSLEYLTEKQEQTIKNIFSIRDKQGNPYLEELWLVNVKNSKATEYISRYITPHLKNLSRKDLRKGEKIRLYKIAKESIERYKKEKGEGTIIDPELMMALGYIESRFNVKAKSKRGALGLYQIMPKMAKVYNLKKPYNPRENSYAAIRILNDEIKRIKSCYNVSSEKELKNLSLVCYNLGFTKFEKALMKNRIERGSNISFKKIEKYLPSETRAYVPNVMEQYATALNGDFKHVEIDHQKT